MFALADSCAVLADVQIVASNGVVTFAQGLVGQPDWKRFSLTAPDEDGLVAVLTSVEDESLALMVTNPGLILPDYGVELSFDDEAELGIQPGDQPLVLTTLSVHGRNITTNLVGPLVINPRTLAAKQVVLTDTLYSTRHPVAEVEAAGAA